MPTESRRPARSAAAQSWWQERQQLERVCDEFETAWQGESAPRLEDYVARVPPGQRAALWRELIELEVFYRRKRGETVDAASYPAAPSLLGDVSIARESALSGAFVAAPAASIDEVASRPRPGGAARHSVIGYDIVSELGRGGMGVVYLARHVRLKRLVALKMILAGELASFDERLRFRREAETAARLQHPHIVQVYDVGEADGHAYLAMEYVAGGTLARKLNGQPLPPRDAAELVEQLAQAIQHAHEQGVVHRDLKPGNVLLSVEGETADSSVSTPQGTRAGANRAASSGGVSKQERAGGLRAKVADFGLAKLLEHGAGMTHTGAVLGTPSYMAPEAASGGDVGVAADVYSLGAILYESLTGRPPFRGATVAHTLEQLKTHEPITPRAFDSRIPRDLETICLKCLEKDPRRRFASARELGDDLRRYLDGELILARPIGTLARGWRWMQRRRAKAVALLGVLFGVLAVLAVSLYFNARLSLSLGETEQQRRIVFRQRDEILSQSVALSRERDDARRLQHESEKLRGQADRQREAAELARYSAEMLLADRFLKVAEVAAADELLRRHRPSAGAADRRGFEWHHLWSCCHRELATIDPACGPIRDVRPAPDGRRLVVCGKDGSITLWERSPPRKLHTLQGPRPGAKTADLPIRFNSPQAAFTADGRFLVTCNGELRLWDAQSGRELTRDGQPLQRDAWSMAIAPTSATLACGTRDGRLALWNLVSQELEQQHSVVKAPIDVVRWSPDERLVLAASERASDRRAVLWDVRERTPRHGFDGDDRRLAVRDMAITRDGRRGVVCESLARWRWHGTRLRLYDLESFQILWTVEVAGECVSSISFSADETVIWGGCHSGVVRRWEANRGEELPTLFGHTAGISALRLLADSDQFVTAGDDGRLRFWSSSPTLEPRRWQAPITGYVSNWCVSPDGAMLAFNDGATVPQLWNLRTLQRIESVDSRLKNASALAYTADSRRLLTLKGNVFTLHDAVTGTAERSFASPLPLQIATVVLASEADRLAVLDGGGRRVLLFELSSGKCLGATAASATRKLGRLALSPDGRFLAVSGLAPLPFLELLSLDDRRSAEVPVNSAAPGSLPSIAAEENHAREPSTGRSNVEASAAGPKVGDPNGQDTNDLPTLIATRSVEFPLISDHSPSSLLFSPSGATVYFASVSGQVLSADLPTRQIRLLLQHSGPVYWLATDRSERVVFSASRAADVKLWDVDRQQEVFVLSGSPADFWGMQYAADASLVVTASTRGVFTLYAAPGW